MSEKVQLLVMLFRELQLHKNITFMKKKIFLFHFLFINFLAFSQNYKTLYEFKWKTEKRDKIYNSELSALIINDNESYFESFENFQYDSLKTKIIADFDKAGGQGQLRFPSEKETSKFRSLIIKDTKKQIYSVEEKIYDKVYFTRYNCKPDWKISTEKSKILGYNTQKAETNFGGRKWIAWFTNEIPINDGPYKFYGLPGLILKISDSEENFIFEAKGITKEKNNIEERNFFTKKVELTPKQWNVFWKKYKEQPSMIFANLNTETTTYVINGKDVESKEVKDSYDKKEKEKINAFKNPIELKNCE